MSKGTCRYYAGLIVCRADRAGRRSGFPICHWSGTNACDWRRVGPETHPRYARSSSLKPLDRTFPRVICICTKFSHRSTFFCSLIEILATHAPFSSLSIGHPERTIMLQCRRGRGQPWFRRLTALPCFSCAAPQHPARMIEINGQ